MQNYTDTHTLRVAWWSAPEPVGTIWSGKYEYQIRCISIFVCVCTRWRSLPPPRSAGRIYFIITTLFTHTVVVGHCSRNIMEQWRGICILLYGQTRARPPNDTRGLCNCVEKSRWSRERRWFLFYFYCYFIFSLRLYVYACIPRRRKRCPAVKRFGNYWNNVLFRFVFYFIRLVL